MNSIDLFCHEWQVFETSKDKPFELLFIICKCEIYEQIFFVVRIGINIHMYFV